jgi:hypothetical protein
MSFFQRDLLYPRTQIISTLQAEFAFPAGHARLDRHPIADLEGLDIAAYLDHLSRRFMSQDQIMRDAAIANATRFPAMDLAAADACSFLQFSLRVS